MRKTIIMTALVVSFALLSVSPVFAAASWGELVADLEKKEMVAQRGGEFLAELRREAPQGTELDLWKKLWVGDARTRAAAGVALMDKVFPGGDPGRWEETSGFVASTSYRPRQLAGLDAFFVTVAALDSINGGEWAAASLLGSFSRSPRGMLYFIERMPDGLQQPISSVVAKTGLRGDWTARSVRRPLPLLPNFGGDIMRDTAEAKRLQYLDGFGRMSGNGYYAWDRDRGYVYRVVENASLTWRRID